MCKQRGTKYTSNGLSCGCTIGITSRLRQTLTRTTSPLTQQSWPCCSCMMPYATDMVIVTLETLNGAFLLWRQAFVEEFCEILLSSLVTKKGQNEGVVSIEVIDDFYQLMSLGKGGQTANVCKIPNPIVTPVR